MQRLFDILISTSAIIVLSPLLLPIMLALRFSGEGEVFFAQTRIGRGGREFKLLKFATMLKNSPNIGTGTVTLAGDSRILPMGRALRKAKLNEIPQLFNVLRGDMSLIGPRPLTRQTFCMYPNGAQKKIASVVPGLSGIGSIVFRNEEKLLSDSGQALATYERIIAPYKAELECWFVENQSFSLYIKSVLATVYVVVLNDARTTWRLFPDIPVPPEQLRTVLGYR
jgi:lipopolysaccharide/colanic/teichoic acid biosynthesis glycosyltransferase